jgi:hypothetical protein
VRDFLGVMGVVVLLLGLGFGLILLILWLGGDFESGL